MPPLYHHESSLSISTCITLAKDGNVSYELDHDNQRVTFAFGHYEDLMLDLSVEALSRMVELAANAIAELERIQAEDDESDDAETRMAGSPV